MSGRMYADTFFCPPFEIQCQSEIVPLLIKTSCLKECMIKFSFICPMGENVKFHTLLCFFFVLWISMYIQKAKKEWIEQKKSSNFNCLCLFVLTRLETSWWRHTWGGTLEMLRLAALCFKSPLGLAQLKQQSSLVSVPCYIPPLPNNKTVVVVASPPDSCYQRGLRTHHALDAPPSTLSPVPPPSSLTATDAKTPELGHQPFRRWRLRANDIKACHCASQRDQTRWRNLNIWASNGSFQDWGIFPRVPHTSTFPQLLAVF